MDLEVTKWNKSDRKRHIPYDVNHMWNLKIKQMNKQDKNKLRDQINSYWKGRGLGVGEMAEGGQLFGDG